MRIVGGVWSGRKLVTPGGEATRPTSEGIRESLFNVLAHRFSHEPRNILDLFAGTGALAFEALSRGGERALLVESDRKALDSIRRNQESLGVGSDVLGYLTNSKIESWGRWINDKGKEFLPIDTIFCDPPYDKGLIPRALKGLQDAAVPLTESAVLICEVSSREKSPDLSCWKLEDERRRGTTGLLFYRHLGW